MANDNRTATPTGLDDGASHVDARSARFSMGRRTRIDLAVLAVFAVAAFAFAGELDLLETLYEFTRRYEAYELDELITVAILLFFATVVFGARRILDLRTEIERRQALQERVERLAYFDALTGLPNRAVFLTRLDQELARSARAGTHVAVLVVDLDHFKPIDDTHGHAAGDAVLRAFARRALECVRAMDTVARIGGDEFVIIVPGIAGTGPVTALAHRLIEAMTEPIDLGERTAVVGLSIGVALDDSCERNATALLRAADKALYVAKEGGRGTFHVFDRALSARHEEQRLIEREFRVALASDGLALHYQPLFDQAREQIVGFEALLRWPHPDRGLVRPDVILPLAEEMGLTVRLSGWVLDRACAEATAWPDAIRVTVNLAPSLFRHDDVVATVAATLRRTGLDPDRLELDIVESAIYDDDGRTLDVLQALKGLGVRLSMDDFGTGASTFSSLLRFPFDKIKIDRPLIHGIADSERTEALVRGAIAIGNAIGVRVTAEGVETRAQMEFLCAEGCVEMQGTLTGGAVPAGRVAEIVADEAATASHEFQRNRAKTA